RVQRYAYFLFRQTFRRVFFKGIPAEPCYEHPFLAVCEMVGDAYFFRQLERYFLPTGKITTYSDCPPLLFLLTLHPEKK
ncbi:MAG: hypothetical protein MR448_05475, partial [Parabacteroides sp.]|nr:hypothetical protein [Parabacteroides sp.]